MTDANERSALDQLDQEGEEVSEQPWSGWVSSTVDSFGIGDTVIGAVLGVAENDNGPYLRMERRDGAAFNMGVPSYLAHNYDLRELVGTVVGFGLVDQEDVGQPDPMNVWRVWTFGGEFPSVTGLEEELDLGADSS